MARFLCPCCHEVVEAAAQRFAFCSACGAPLTTENILPVQLIRAAPEEPGSKTVPEPAP
jgi:predicted amidophosphoribosyltransferase